MKCHREHSVLSQDAWQQVRGRKRGSQWWVEKLCWLPSAADSALLSPCSSSSFSSSSCSSSSPRFPSLRSPIPSRRSFHGIQETTPLRARMGTGRRTSPGPGRPLTSRYADIGYATRCTVAQYGTLGQRCTRTGCLQGLLSHLPVPSWSMARLKDGTALSGHPDRAKMGQGYERAGPEGIPYGCRGNNQRSTPEGGPCTMKKVLPQTSQRHIFVETSALQQCGVRCKRVAWA